MTSDYEPSHEVPAPEVSSLTEQIYDALETDPQSAFGICETALRGSNEREAAAAARSLDRIIDQYPYEGATLVRALLGRQIFDGLPNVEIVEINNLLGEKVEPLLHSGDPKLRAHTRGMLGGQANYVMRFPLHAETDPQEA